MLTPTTTHKPATDLGFEWTRAEFQNWTNRVATSSGYKTHFLLVGPEDSAVGLPTQMEIFEGRQL